MKEFYFYYNAMIIETPSEYAYVCIRMIMRRRMAIWRSFTLIVTRHGRGFQNTGLEIFLAMPVCVTYAPSAPRPKCGLTRGSNPDGARDDAPKSHYPTTAHEHTRHLRAFVGPWAGPGLPLGHPFQGKHPSRAPRPRRALSCSRLAISTASGTAGRDWRS